jgi:hypothetical protein
MLSIFSDDKMHIVWVGFADRPDGMYVAFSIQKDDMTLTVRSSSEGAIWTDTLEATGTSTIEEPERDPASASPFSPPPMPPMVEAVR